MGLQNGGTMAAQHAEGNSAKIWTNKQGNMDDGRLLEDRSGPVSLLSAEGTVEPTGEAGSRARPARRSGMVPNRHSVS